MSNRETSRLMVVAALVAAWMTSGAAVADAHGAPRPLIVGAAVRHSAGTAGGHGVDKPPGRAATAQLEFRPAGQNKSDGAGLEAAFASNPPSPGQSFRGQRQTETHGTCTPLSYSATIAGKTVQLTITTWPK